MWLLGVVGSTCAARADVARSHQAWSTEEGLPETSVHQILQSRDGYLWLATENGAVRFDGSAFQVLRRASQAAFQSDDVNVIAQDTAGALWFGTANGLVGEVGSTYRRYDTTNGLPSNQILSLASCPDGSLLVLTAGGLVRMLNGVVQPVTELKDTVLGLQSAPDGSVWLLTSEGPERYQGGLSGRPSLPCSTASGRSPGEAILGVQFGPGGAIWTRSATALCVSTPAGMRRFTAGRDLPGNRVSALYVDHTGTAWIGTDRGLFSLGSAPGEALQTVDALRLESVLAITEDREGNLWVGTETSGLHALRPRKFRSDPAAAGEAVTTVIAAPEDTLCYGTREDGFRCLHHGTPEQPVPAGTLTSPVILSMARGQNADLWVGTPDGLNRIHGSQVQQYTSSSGLPDDFVRTVLVDGRGTVWAGTRRGLARLEKDRITVLTHANGLGSDSIGPLLDTGSASGSPVQDLWIGTSAGLSHLHGSQIENYSVPRGPEATIVTALTRRERGGLWVALHEGGLSRFESGQFHLIRSPELPVEIVALFEDRAGFLWLRGSRGVFRVALTALQACADQSGPCSLNVAHYGVEEGMPSDLLAAQGFPSATRDDTGQLWFATRKGLAVVDPAHLPIDRVPPPVVLQRVVVDAADIPVAPGSAEIGAGHSRYTFDYIALSYTLPQRNRYRYMLEGFDKTWIDAGTARTVSYTSLPPGRYRFRVQAQNSDGVWSQTDAQFRLRILPPIYRRWWFACLVLLAIVGFATAAFHLRLRVLQRRFSLVLNERNRMAREIHDTLAQDLVSIALQVDLATQLLQTNEADQAASQLRSTRILVQDGLEAARQSIWNLRANTAENSLPARLTELTKRYGASEPAPRLKIGGAYRRLPAEIEDQVLRIAQEGLANCYRHAAATEVLLQLHYERGTLRLSLQDNGRGFTPEAARHLEGHYGLRGMQERATALHGHLTVASSPGEGTTISLLVPLAGKGESLP